MECLYLIKKGTSVDIKTHMNNKEYNIKCLIKDRCPSEEMVAL